MVRVVKYLLLAVFSGGVQAQSLDGCAPFSTGGALYFICDEYPYDLGDLPEFVQDIEWPEAPTITESTVNITNDAGWSSVADNTLHTVAAATYTGKTVSCSHCEFVLDDNAIIDGALTITGHHVKWTGGQKIGDGSMTYSGTGDLLIDNFHAVLDGAGHNGNFSGPSVDDFAWNRIAIINSTFETINNTSGAGWVLYVDRSYPIDTNTNPRGENMILANVRFDSNQQTMRLQQVDNVVIIDSYLGSPSTTNGGRLHCVRDVYIKSTIRVGGSSFGCDPQFDDALFDDVSIYDAFSIGFSNNWGQFCDNCTVQNSQFHWETGFGGAPALGDASDGGGNPNTVEWDGSTVPDDSTYGADH